jgi:hypothetical protein
MKVKYEPGDRCWYANGSDRLVEGKVLYQLDIPDDAGTHYLIVTETHVDPIYVVRNTFTMSCHGPKGPLGIWDREDRAARLV